MEMHACKIGHARIGHRGYNTFFLSSLSIWYMPDVSMPDNELIQIFIESKRAHEKASDTINNNLLYVRARSLCLISPSIGHRILRTR